MMAVNSVEAACWDMSNGWANSFIGKIFLRQSSKGSSYPDSMDHSGIVIFDTLYEYGQIGVLHSPIPMNGVPNPAYPTDKLRKRYNLGKTDRTKREFEEWLETVKKTEWQGYQYSVVNHNCLHFTKTVCKFLNVPYPVCWDKSIQWMKDNPDLAQMFSNTMEHRG